jgi:hypothetical protein
LCGTSLCRQSFLDFVASDSTQQLLTRWHSPADRFAMLFDASVSQFRSDATRLETDALLAAHGLALAAAAAAAGPTGAEAAAAAGRPTGAPPPPAPFWLRRFVAKCLKDFVDKERVYLPIQLKLDGVSAQAANQEARSLIEQRVQALVGTLSSVRHVFDRQVRKKKHPSSHRLHFEPASLFHAPCLYFSFCVAPIMHSFCVPVPGLGVFCGAGPYVCVGGTAAWRVRRPQCARAASPPSAPPPRSKRAKTRARPRARCRPPRKRS